MSTEIPAGTNVKVAMISKGVTTIKDAEVLAHMDGLVHVNMDGEAVSVDPSQIVTPDAPIQGMQTTATPQPTPEPAPAPVVAGIVAALAQRVLALESLPSYCSELDGRMEGLKVRLAAAEEKIAAFVPNSPEPTAAPTPAEQNPNDEKRTAPSESAEPAGEVGKTDGPEAIAGTSGQ